jgi:hypothetical protein
MVIVLLFTPMAGGCAMTWQPDTLCSLPRPMASTNDTLATRDSQAKAAKVWDQQCTLMGMWR